MNKGVRLGFPLSSTLFNSYIDEVIRDWLQAIKRNILTKDLILNYDHEKKDECENETSDK
jgi:hypothetical protein